VTASARPPVSVVVPAYDRAASIRPALDSVLRQTFSDFELIVVDDGSTDGTREVVRAIDDPRLRLVETPRNMGASAARNLGIAEARGTWVAFQDSDDEWLPLKLEKQMARLLAPGAGFVAGYCGMLILGEPDAPDGPGAAGGRLTARYFPGPEATELEGDLVVPLLRDSLISTQTLVARRDALREVGGFDPELRSLIDWDCALRLAPLGPIAFVDEPLVLQRFSLNSITRDRARRIASQIRLVEKHAPLLAGRPAIHPRRHYVIAGGQRQAGDLAAARGSLARARALDPANPRYWAMSLGLAALALAPRRAAAP
jgi:glycosyltransferase involved in cell wall biosynthesis